MSGMYINDYQLKAKEFAVYEKDYYPFLALSEEVGELNSVIAKAARKGRGLNELQGREYDFAINELGDVLWQLCACCNELGVRLDDVAEQNIGKLTFRKHAGTIAATVAEQRDE